MKRLMLLLMVSAAVLRGDVLQFGNEAPIEDAKVLGVRNGVLFYQVGEERFRRPLGDLSNLAITRVDQDAVGQVRLEAFRAYPGPRSADRLVTIAVTGMPTRIHEPLVRVFTLTQDAKGEREVKQWQNSRSVRDPSMLDDLPMVNSLAYARKSFLVPGEGVIAWRLEVWLDGDLRAARTQNDREVQESWWRRSDRVRRGMLKSIDEVAPQAAETGGEEPPVTCTITVCRLKPVLGGEAKAVFGVEYALRSPGATQAALPKVTLHYVTESADGRRVVKSASIEKDAGSTVALQPAPHSTDRMTTRSLEYPLPANVGVSSTTTRLGGEEMATVVVWRVQAAYDDQVVAVKEGGDMKARQSLPGDWWE